MKIGSRVKFKSLKGDLVIGEVIDVKPNGKVEVWNDHNYTILDERNILQHLPAKRRINYVTKFEKGGKVEDAKKKWRKVYREYLDGKLRHGSTNEIVTDKDTAMAIAYSEARDIYPMFQIYKNGGSPSSQFEELCLVESPERLDKLFDEDVYDFNLKVDGRSYQGSVDLPTSEKGVSIVTWDNKKPENWPDLEATISNRAFQQANEKYGLGGFVAGGILGAYLGYKTGRRMKQKKDVFKFEKSLLKKGRKGAKKLSDKQKEIRKRARLKKAMKDNADPSKYGMRKLSEPQVLKDGGQIEKLGEYRFSHGHCGVKGAFKEGGKLGINNVSNFKNIFIRVANQYNSYTNVVIRPIAVNKYRVGVTVYAVDLDTEELSVKNIKTDIINLKERKELLTKISDEPILEFTTY